MIPSFRETDVRSWTIYLKQILHNIKRMGVEKVYKGNEKCLFLFLLASWSLAARKKKHSSLPITWHTKSQGWVYINYVLQLSRWWGMFFSISWHVSTIYIKFYTSSWFIVPTIKAKNVILAESTLFSICELQVRSNKIYCFRSKSECLHKLSSDMRSPNHKECWSNI